MAEDFQFDLGCEDYFALSGVGLNSDPGGVSLGVHACRESLEHGLGDEAELTTRVILDSKGQMTKIEIFH